jgi:hypothetical protein
MTGVTILAAAARAAILGAAHPARRRRDMEPRRTSPDADRRGVVLVGTDAGVFRARLDGGADGGADVAVAVDGALLAELGSVRCLAEDAATGALFAGFGMRGSGLRRSRDGGATWAPVEGWPDARQAWSAVPRDDGTLWVGSQPADLWVGARDGTWRPHASVRAVPERARWDFIAPPFEAHLLHVARSPEEPRRWAAAVEQGGILESDDDGATWRQTSPVWDAHQVAFARDGALLAATGDGLHRRAAGTLDWRPAGVGGYVTGLARGDGGALFAATGDDAAPLRASRDDGRTWRRFGPRGVPAPDSGVHALAVVPGLPDAVLHGAGGSVFLVTGGAARAVATGLPAVRRVLVVDAHGRAPGR